MYFEFYLMVNPSYNLTYILIINLLLIINPTYILIRFQNLGKCHNEVLQASIYELVFMKFLCIAYPHIIS